MQDANELVTLAQRLSRGDFEARHPHLFIIGRERLREPTAGQRTVQGLVVPAGLATGKHPPLTAEAEPTKSEPLPEPTAEPEKKKELLIRAVKKTQTTFPTMITVGRANNNDIVIRDAQVSKFHAYFREADEALELFDAGSRNGTFVGEDRLEQKVARRVRAGMELRFGQLALTLLSAPQAWEWLRRHTR